MLEMNGNPKPKGRPGRKPKTVGTVHTSMHITRQEQSDLFALTKRLRLGSMSEMLALLIYHGKTVPMEEWQAFLDAEGRVKREEG